jgi:hypothetical protein
VRGPDPAEQSGTNASARVARQNGPSDEALLERAIRQLRQTGRIEFTGEFGYEIATFLPFVSWLKSDGHLNNAKVITYRGMAPYYFFLDQEQLVEKDAPRRFVRDVDRYYPTHRTDNAELRDWHRPPDYRAHYASRARRFDRPTLFIQNKFTVEWNIGPINYIPLLDLVALLQIARDRFQVIYSRPDSRLKGAGYSSDERMHCNYPDRAILDRFPEALVLEDLVREEGRPYNEVKLEVLAGTHLFFAVQGGGTHLLAAFNNSFLAVIHRRGTEYPFAYEQGIYKFLATPAPELVVARTDAQIGEAVCMFGSLDVENGKVVRCEPAPKRNDQA